MSGFGEVIQHPGRNAINTGLVLATTAQLTSWLGRPRATYSAECEPLEDAGLRARMVTARIGPFRATGLDLAVTSLQHVFNRVRVQAPELWAAAGSAGMLCARRIRGARTPSRHSWGIAIDLTWDGVLQSLGSAGVQRGALALYRWMREEGWYWGAGFTRNDPMHWEMSAGRLQEMLRR